MRCTAQSGRFKSAELRAIVRIAGVCIFEWGFGPISERRNRSACDLNDELNMCPRRV